MLQLGLKIPSLFKYSLPSFNRWNLINLHPPSIHQSHFRAFSSQQNDDHSDADKIKKVIISEFSDGLGVSNFTERIDRKFLVVDKTAYLYKLLNITDSAIVFGPRRFGKTHNLTTIEAIFGRGKAWWHENCADFAIVRDYQYEFPEHPVLHFDFSGTTSSLGIKNSIRLRLNFLIKDSGLQEELFFLVTRYQEDLSDEVFFEFLTKTLLAVSEKFQKGVVILIDEYDRPFTSIVEDLLIRPENTQSFVNHPKIVEMTNFLKKLFEVIKILQVQKNSNGISCVRFEYVTGILPISHLGLLSEKSEIFNVRDNEEFDGIIGYTDKELLKNFGDALENMALGEFARREKTVELDDSNEQNKKKIMKIKKEIENDIHKNYNGFRFSEKQKDALYSPVAIHHLFSGWNSTTRPHYRPYYAYTGSSQLIWKTVRKMSFEGKVQFISALLDEKNSHTLFTCQKDDLTKNQTLDDLFFKPEQLFFFSGLLSVQKKGSTENLWNLGIVNNEMRNVLFVELQSKMQLYQNGFEILEKLFHGYYEGYFNLINESLKYLATFLKITNSHKAKESEVEHYGEMFFETVQNRLMERAEYDKDIREDFKIHSFGTIKDKATGKKTIVYFDITNKESEEKKKVALIFEVKCSKTIDQSLKEAKENLIQKSQALKNGFHKKYDFLENYERIWVAVALGPEKLRGAILYKLETIDEEEKLVLCESWPRNLKYQDV